MATFQSSDGTAAVLGQNTADGFGVVGISDGGKAVEGRTKTGQAIVGIANAGTGVIGVADGFGVVGSSGAGKAVEGRTNTGTAIVGIAGSGGRAGFFEGNVAVTGQLTIPGPVRPEPAAQFGSHVGIDGNLDVAGDIQLVGGDCAEDFEVAAGCEDLIVPGVVVVLGPKGLLRHSTRAYDKRVAGVVAGAGGLRPGIILDRGSDRSRRLPVALMGKVSCNVDADYGRVEVGDLLTTSDTLGHAMKVSDPSRAFGAVIGKALGSLRSGRAMIPVLVCLQ
jgi:hypothetical protein